MIVVQDVRSEVNVRVTTRRKRRVFIVHPSQLLTDFEAHGDGLLTYRYIYELAARGHRICVACESVTLSKPLPSNVVLYPIKSRFGSSTFLGRAEYAWKMRRLFEKLDRTEHFEIAHQLNPVYAGLSLGLIGLRVPLILGPYVAQWPFMRSSRLKTLGRDVIGRFQQRFAHAILISGPAARSRILRKNVGPDQVFTVPYGIDLDMFPAQPVPVGDPVILYLGGLTAHKGLSVLLAAFDVVAARVSAARLVVAGDGPERDRVRALAAASPYGDRITFRGYISRQEVSQALASCSVYCLTSFGEPYGMSLVEAMAAGRPVVATNTGGPADLVDRRGGYLVPPGDAPALAEALESVLTNPERAQAMGAFNRRAMSAYDWTKVIDRLENAYDEVVLRQS